VLKNLVYHTDAPCNLKQ